MNTFQEFLTERLAAYPDKIALQYGDRCLTYFELERKANAAAEMLISRGVPAGTLVGLLMDDKIEFISAIIGILKAGCVFVPLDPDNPAHRTCSMLEISGATFLLSDTPQHLELIHQSPLKNKIKTFQLEKNTTATQSPAAGTHNRQQPQPPLPYTPEDPIYVYFTSGTTGTPAAVLGKNKSLLHFIKWEIETFGIHENLRFSQLTPVGFDAFLRELFVSLCTGGTLCIPARREIAVNGETLVYWFDRQQINLVHCVPTLFRLFNNSTLQPGNFKQLKYILLSGETIRPAELEKWYAVFGDRIRLVNLYGPTETTMIKTYYPMQPADAAKKSIPVGKPMKGCQVIIMDRHMEICDQGMVGEIYIRTPYRTLGYCNNPELNQRRFTPNPFNHNPADLLYKTGDWGRILPCGNLELTGRKDHQVKIRGARVEPAEIENLLVKRPGVAEAVVVPVEDPKGDTSLCAYIVPGDGFNLSQLRAYLAQQLPGHMVPAYFREIQQIPLTPNGKTDRRTLADMPLETDTTYIPPTHPIEKKLASIWQQVLGTDDYTPGIDDGFFHLGGHSLKATLLVAKIRKVFHIKIELPQVFLTPTIRGLAQYIRTASTETHIAVETAEKRDYYELSSGQKRLYLMQQMSPEDTGRNMPRGFTIQGPICLDKLENAFRQLITRHESFRTSFLMAGSPARPVQRIHSHVDFRIQDISLPAHSGDKAAPDSDSGNSGDTMVGTIRAREIMKAFIRPFDLSCAPLMRVGFFNPGTDTHETYSDGEDHAQHVENAFLVVDMHHIISDGASQGVLINEFIALYEEKEPPPLPLTYKDYACRNNSPSMQQIIKQQEGYWLERFKTPPLFLNLPFDGDPHGVPENVGFQERMSIGVEETRALEQQTAETGVTLYMILMAVYAVLLWRYTGQEDIVMVSPVAGRTHDDLQQIIGMFVNMLPIRLRPNRGKTFAQFLTELNEIAVDAFLNQDYPYEELIRNLDLPRSPSGDPLAQAAFTLHNNLDPKRAALGGGVSITPYIYDGRVSIYPLDLEAVESDNIISLTFNYSPRFFRPATAKLILGHYYEILEQILSDPNLMLEDITVTGGLSPTKSTKGVDENGDFAF